MSEEKTPELEHDDRDDEYNIGDDDNTIELTKPAEFRLYHAGPPETVRYVLSDDDGKELHRISFFGVKPNWYVRLHWWLSGYRKAALD